MKQTLHAESDFSEIKDEFNDNYYKAISLARTFLAKRAQGGALETPVGSSGVPTGAPIGSSSIRLSELKLPTSSGKYEE